MENQYNKIRVLVVGINTGNDEHFSYQLKEAINLCEAINFEVIETITQNLAKPNSATYIGSGKLLEISSYIDALNIDLVLFNEELSPMQLRNVQQVITCDVIDRTMLILEIFKLRAKTKEAVLQVEIAELKYMLPRLVGSYTNLSRIGGGGGGSAGARRGSGETKLELDRRHIEKRISKLKEELEEITLARKTSRKGREANNLQTVAFVGYTNAGKSSTINKLLSIYMGDEKHVFVQDMLFATLETSTRKIKLPNNHEFLITDTVGFVNKLPHHLVQSFKSTLEEITEASLIVHIVDTSSPYLKLQIETTNQVLKEIGVEGIPLIYAFNKIDLVYNKSFIPKEYNPSISISALDGSGFEELISYIEDTLFSNIVECDLLIPYTNGDIYSILKEKCEVLNTEYLNNGIKVTVRMSKHLNSLYNEYTIK